MNFGKSDLRQMLRVARFLILTAIGMAFSVAALGEEVFPFKVQLVPPAGVTLTPEQWRMASGSVKILDEKGRPILHAGGENWADGRVDPDGAMLLQLKPGLWPREECKVEVTILEHRSFTYSGAAQAKISPDRLTQVQQPLEIMLTGSKPFEFQIVSGPTGNPLANRRVELFLNDKQRGMYYASAEAVTDKKGLVSFRIHPGKKYTIQDPGFGALLDGDSDPIRNTDVDLAEIRTHTSPWVIPTRSPQVLAEFVVRNAAGELIPTSLSGSVRVVGTTDVPDPSSRFRGDCGESYLEFFPAANGRMRIYDLPLGTYRLEPAPGGNDFVHCFFVSGDEFRLSKGDPVQKIQVEIGHEPRRGITFGVWAMLLLQRMWPFMAGGLLLFAVIWSLLAIRRKNF